LVLSTFVVFGTDLVTFSLDLIAFLSIYLMISLSLNFEVGFGGIPDFGKVLYFAAGASIAGSLGGSFAAWLLGAGSPSSFVSSNPLVASRIDTILPGEPFMALLILVVSVLIAAGVGAIFGFASSFPAIRLRGDFLGMSLFALGIFYWVLMGDFTPLVGGPNGIRVPNIYAWAGDYQFLLGTSVLALFAIITFVFLEKVARSPFARVLRAMRDNEQAASAYGKNVVRVRMIVMIIASMITAVAGCLYVFYAGVVLPDSVGNQIPWTVFPWLIVIIGGRANNLGVVVGATLYELFTKGMNILKFSFASVIPFDVNWLYYIVFAALIIVVLSRRGQGLLREKPTNTIGLKRRFLDLPIPGTSRTETEPRKENRLGNDPE
jgi:branched-chain amino acid transport system permease protein